MPPRIFFWPPLAFLIYFLEGYACSTFLDWVFGRNDMSFMDHGWVFFHHHTFVLLHFSCSFSSLSHIWIPLGSIDPVRLLYIIAIPSYLSTFLFTFSPSLPIHPFPVFILSSVPRSCIPCGTLFSLLSASVCFSLLYPSRCVHVLSPSLPPIDIVAIVHL